MIHQLIYVSTALRVFSNTEIGEILESSRRYNSKSGITGMLLSHDGSFFQMLEGNEAAVSACYARIETDPRHKSPIVLVRKQTQQRVFPRWSMGHAKPSDMSEEHRDIVVSLSNFAANLSELDEAGARELNILAKNFVSSFGKLEAV
ncbi:BLUF domain-containing protein [Pyruvatibacter sp.]|uniref:BLUF domain-containing protein n=1 Tax=Pyruvatibacter sp. TaxID=1981328 RepID=UPI0032655D7D